MLGTALVPLNIGGSVIFTHAGDDCTDIFAAFHPVSALKNLEKFEIGQLDESIVPPAYLANKLKPEKQKEFERAYRTLRAKIFAMGLFNASLPFYAYKVASVLVLLAVAVKVALAFPSVAGAVVGGLIMGLYLQQAAWLCHDFTHHQVFKNRTYNDYGGLFMLNLCQGFSMQWWKSKHNSHHAVPNLHASVEGACDGDPDIDTMPILAWTLKMAESAKDSSVGRFFIQWQAFIYFPILLLARLSWAHQCWVFVFGGWGQHSVKGAALDQKKNPYLLAEQALIIVHYALYLSVLCRMSLIHALVFLIVAQTSCGFFLAIIFGLGHNGMAVYPASERPDFWKLQVSTTRNITSNWFVEWFSGGLNYQVDHHLFPMLPRHNLKKVHGMVKQFCEEQGVTYHEADVWHGTLEVLAHLSTVSAEFIKEFPAA
jgi:fatty acid desaturase